MTKPNCVVFDLDGTIANATNRNYYDDTRCYSDEVIWPVATYLIATKRYLDAKIIIVTGRKWRAYDETLRWLRDKLQIIPDELYMRDDDDNIKDFIFKEQIYREHIEPYFNVIAWWDDRDRVVKHLRSLGITVFQPADGNY